MNGERQFVITREWAETYKTPAGGWTKAQLAAIGVAWPPPRGWLKEVVGMAIDEAARHAFEEGCR
ncbi:hypothetical protein [Methylomagnum ishizawai]|uniref:hypothetical protein n=1 Tax=Methylomagnum ishizawai TaxID=1760988 RepID=UPI001C320C66|nr:hypothetical protein [Methylomagnum ishizawai]BBL73188.1 hypothetical protein MishRS11D_02860 [Methylomagnum ishizawai]